VKSLNNLLFGTSGWSYKEWVGRVHEKRSIEKKKASGDSKFQTQVNVRDTLFISSLSSGLAARIP